MKYSIGINHLFLIKTNFPDGKIIQPFVHLGPQLFPQEGNLRFVLQFGSSRSAQDVFQLLHLGLHLLCGDVPTAVDSGPGGGELQYIQSPLHLRYRLRLSRHPDGPFPALLPQHVGLVVLGGDGDVLVLGGCRPVLVLDVTSFQ